MKKIIIIPAFNEEKNIGSVIESIRATDLSYDIVVIDDFSKDRTVKEAQKAGAKVLSHPINMGYGVSLQTGYKYAAEYNYDIIVQVDADGQHDPKYIPIMLEFMASNKADVVIGSRFVEKTSYRSPFFRKIGTHFFSFLIKLVTKKRIYDPTSGYRIINKSVMPLLISDIFPVDFPDADLIIILDYWKFKVVEYPVEMRRNKEGKSMHKGVAKNIFYVFKICLSIFLIVVSRKVTGGVECR